MNAHAETPADRVYRAYWQDGSLDLFAGVGLALIGLGWLLDEVVLSAIVPALIVPVWYPFRARFIEPRLGHVRFDERRRASLRQANVVIFAVGCLVLILGVATYLFFRPPELRPTWLTQPVAALPAVLVGLGGLLSAAMFQIPRLAGYGIACVAAGGVVAVLDANPGWSLLAGGIVVTVSGVVLISRFFRRFPVLPGEMS